MSAVVASDSTVAALQEGFFVSGTSYIIQKNAAGPTSKLSRRNIVDGIAIAQLPADNLCQKSSFLV